MKKSFTIVLWERSPATVIGVSVVDVCSEVPGENLGAPDVQISSVSANVDKHRTVACLQEIDK